ncbi:MAG TPA: glycosyltransferase [Terriglobales bacterium]
MSRDPVYILMLSGAQEDAERYVVSNYAGCDRIFLSKRELRESGWRGQVRGLRKLQGRALVFFVQNLSDLQEPQLVAWSSLLHRCRTTVVADADGSVLTYGRWSWPWMLPKVILSSISDSFVLLASLWLIRLIGSQPAAVNANRRPQEIDLAYLYPFPLDKAIAGGAMSHVEGFLSGLVLAGGTCEIFSGRPLPGRHFTEHAIPAKRRFYLLRESLALSYNLRFVFAVRKLLRGRNVGAVYQRHGRFVVGGVLLSRWLRVPLVLEYNGSEVWGAKHWDAPRFSRWMQLCEQASLRCAHHVVVVSDPSKQELLEQGIPEERILVNPNGVDPDVFHPNCGGNEIRSELGIAKDELVITFVGTFDRWHGVEVLVEAIQELLRTSSLGMRFLLIGDGPLHAEARHQLQTYAGKQVLFTGLVPHARVPAHLDASDILVSPHIPMPDGKPFFGSPTKLFEYMAMAKGIVASQLDQLARVLEHGRSAWLVEPGNVRELVSAIDLLAGNPGLRNTLGHNARNVALERHTWRQNAGRVLDFVPRTSVREQASAALSVLPSSTLQ